MSVEPGEKAPDFTLPTDGAGSVTLSELNGKKVVLYFYPKDDTSGCTAEACGFRDAFPDYGGTGAVVIGISKDSVASHDKFKKKHGLPFILASDTGGDVCEKYGVWVEKSMYGRKYMGIERATFLIDGTGIVRGVWHKVRVPGHVGEVLKAARASDRRDRLRHSSRRGGGDPRHGRPRGQGGGEPSSRRPLGRRDDGSWAARCRRPVPPGRDTPCCVRPGRCRNAGRSALGRAGSRSFTPSLTSSSTRSISAGISSRGLPPRICRVRSSTTGSASPRKRPIISNCRPAGWPISGPPTAICRRMTGCGRPPTATADDLLARLAVVPLVLEARGLDVTPEMAARLERIGDVQTRSDPAAHLSRRDRPRRYRIALVRAPLPDPPPRPGGGLSRSQVPPLLQRRAEAALQP